MPDFHYQDPFPIGKDSTKYRKVEGSEQYVSIGKFDGKDVLKVEPEALTVLANQAMRDISFMLRPEHNEQVAKILSDPEASQNDRGVAMAFLRNAEISARTSPLRRTPILTSLPFSSAKIRTVPDSTR